eukprot:CAMPEP_0116940058 /NCGR_PEP_ID=MMETSP0467-20121206/33129_1 /TAXON_ID=283647 /ORGANISM="Mesodinium pulex, Strain SPMC105" /LENGTH=178 /DNA_ID=CAMNT_0004622503 /DNA_START=1417 /DNA_END=1953 /DNA_ORIENTATION=-
MQKSRRLQQAQPIQVEAVLEPIEHLVGKVADDIYEHPEMKLIFGDPLFFSHLFVIDKQSHFHVYEYVDKHDQLGNMHVHLGIVKQDNLWQHDEVQPHHRLDEDRLADEEGGFGVQQVGGLGFLDHGELADPEFDRGVLEHQLAHGQIHVELLSFVIIVQALYPSECGHIEVESEEGVD